ncbi:hypothetical protein D3C85_1560390 [compost metagenome]
MPRPADCKTFRHDRVITTGTSVRGSISIQNQLNFFIRQIREAIVVCDNFADIIRCLCFFQESIDELIGVLLLIKQIYINFINIIYC